MSEGTFEGAHSGKTVRDVAEMSWHDLAMEVAFDGGFWARRPSSGSGNQRYAVRAGPISVFIDLHRY